MPINMDREQWLKGGHCELLRIADFVVTFYWEVWRTPEEERARVAPRARFIIERNHVSGRQIAKQAFDSYDEAAKAFDTFEREYAIELAKKAFELGDSVKIRRPPTF